MFHGDCGLTGKWVEVDIHLDSYRRSSSGHRFVFAHWPSARLMNTSNIGVIGIDNP